MRPTVIRIDIDPDQNWHQAIADLHYALSFGRVDPRGHSRFQQAQITASDGPIQIEINRYPSSTKGTRS